MAKLRAKKPLRWRPTCIRYWREYRDFTLESAVDAITQPPYNIKKYTHNSLGRVENGKQMPSIELIEALARLYQTDVDSLINRRPEQGPANAQGILTFWDKADPPGRDLIFDLAKRVAGAR